MCSQSIDQNDFSLGSGNSSVLASGNRTLGCSQYLGKQLSVGFGQYNTEVFPVPWGKYYGLLPDYTLNNCILMTCDVIG